MEHPPEGMRICPTRPDGRSTLFAHAISPPECAKRQGALYHKCASCVHANGYEAPRVTVELAPAAEELNGTASAAASEPARPEAEEAPSELSPAD